VVEALLAKGADVEAKDEVSFARAGALCPSRSLDGASAARLERHSEYKYTPGRAQISLCAATAAVARGGGTRPRGARIWWEGGEMREAGAGPERTTRRLLVRGDGRSY
jgi:hypothetical protein